ALERTCCNHELPDDRQRQRIVDEVDKAGTQRRNLSSRYPVTEPNGAQGVVIAQVFAVKENSTDDFVRKAEPIFADYRAAGVREVGVLASFEGPNNFPQLPVRTDGPYVLWLGILKDNAALVNFRNSLEERSLQTLAATGLLRSTPEVVILDPTH